jgi:hypothetical protein
MLRRLRNFPDLLYGGGLLGLRVGAGCDRRDLPVGHFRKPGQRVTQIGIRIHAVVPAASHDGVKHRADPARVFGSHKEPVLFSHSSGADRVFYEVGADPDVPIIQKSAQWFPLVKAVIDCHTRGTLGKMRSACFRALQRTSDPFDCS